jgi:hypothetical protein
MALEENKKLKDYFIDQEIKGKDPNRVLLKIKCKKSEYKNENNKILFFFYLFILFFIREKCIKN